MAMLGEWTYVDIDTPIIDPIGLTDPFIARCQTVPHNRPGHLQRNIPAAYMVARQCVNQQPGWERRLDNGDITLIHDTLAASDQPNWLRPREQKVYNELAILTRGPIFSARRFALIFNYTFSNPRPYDRNDTGPSILAGEMPSAMLMFSRDLAKAVKLLGMTPSELSFGETREYNGVWVGPADTSPTAIHLKVSQPTRTAITFCVREFGDSVVHPRSCSLIVAVNGRTQSLLEIRAKGVYLVPLELAKGYNVITLQSPESASSHRPMSDPRPMLLYVVGLGLEDEAGAADQIQRLGLMLHESIGAQAWFVAAIQPDYQCPLDLWQEARDDNRLLAIQTSALTGPWTVHDGIHDIWLGPREEGQVCMFVQSDRATTLRLSFHADANGPAAPVGGCPMRVSVNNRPAFSGLIHGSADLEADVNLERGLNRITFELPADAGAGRGVSDFRPLMVRLTAVWLAKK